jgi:hypothetical protein
MRPNARGNMRLLQKGVILGSLLAVLVSHPASQNVADVVKQSSDAVVLIVISNSAGQETALGSGFLVSADGEVVTNYHVIKEAHSAIVKLSNGAFFPVNGVLASDSDRDLAILKVNGKNLPFLSLGDIEKVKVGEHVVAIGSPLGLEGTVSDGIVSGIRDVAGKRWVLTTAPASHGNSGGPLLDMSNHVVGVVTRIENPELGQNLNLAVPCDAVAELRLIAEQQQTKPLEAVTNRDEASPTEDVVWTSLMTSRDFRVRQDGDYLYVDRISVRPVAGAAGLFARSELKKSSDGKWRGKTHEHEYCTYARGGTNTCNFDTDIEIDFMSDKRIEGKRTVWTKFDCKKCEAQLVESKAFTWIPK